MRPSDLFGASPKTVLNKPFFHCQDQKAYNVNGGSSIADAWTKRDLNTVIVNDIQGASLASNAVNLPAGTYYVEAGCVMYPDTATIFIAGVFKDGVKVLQGVSLRDPAANAINIQAAGTVVLSVPGVIDIRYYAGLGTPTNGLGLSNNAESVTDPTIPSIYADLKIWQLDRSLEIAPVAVNSGLQNIAGVNTQDNIDGLDITTSGQVITVTKGSCMNSTRDTVMALTSNTTWTVASTNNLETYLFLVRLVADGTFTVKGYNTYAGPSSDVLVDKWRFISWAKNNGSGVLMPYRQVGSRVDWEHGTNRPTLTTSLTQTYVAYDISSYIPYTVCSALVLVANQNQAVSASIDGTTEVVGSYPATATIGSALSFVSRPSIYLKQSGVTAATVYFNSITLRR